MTTVTKNPEVVFERALNDEEFSRIELYREKDFKSLHVNCRFKVLGRLMSFNNSILSYQSWQRKFPHEEEFQSLIEQAIDFYSFILSHHKKGEIYNFLNAQTFRMHLTDKYLATGAIVGSSYSESYLNFVREEFFTVKSGILCKYHPSYRRYRKITSDAEDQYLEYFNSNIKKVLESEKTLKEILLKEDSENNKAEANETKKLYLLLCQQPDSFIFGVENCHYVQALSKIQSHKHQNFIYAFQNSYLKGLFFNPLLKERKPQIINILKALETFNLLEERNSYEVETAYGENYLEDERRKKFYENYHLIFNFFADNSGIEQLLLTPLRELVMVNDKLNEGEGTFFRGQRPLNSQKLLEEVALFLKEEKNLQFLKEFSKFERDFIDFYDDKTIIEFIISLYTILKFYYRAVLHSPHLMKLLQRYFDEYLVTTNKMDMCEEYRLFERIFIKNLNPINYKEAYYGAIWFRSSHQSYINNQRSWAKKAIAERDSLLEELLSVLTFRELKQLFEWCDANERPISHTTVKKIKKLRGEKEMPMEWILTFL